MQGSKRDTDVKSRLMDMGRMEERVKVKSLSRVRLFAILWTVAHQTPQSMGFSRQEYWSSAAIPFSKGSSQPRD